MSSGAPHALSSLSALRESTHQGSTQLQADDRSSRPGSRLIGDAGWRLSLGSCSAELLDGRPRLDFYKPRRSDLRSGHARQMLIRGKLRLIRLTRADARHSFTICGPSSEDGGQLDRCLRRLSAIPSQISRRLRGPTSATALSMPLRSARRLGGWLGYGPLIVSASASAMTGHVGHGKRTANCPVGWLGR